ncbi:MAG: hypothetical protein Fur007_01780 [Rhodoferax sp.]
MSLHRPLRRALEQVWLYLPVLIMGLLALSTYWLVRNTPGLESVSAQPRSLPPGPDYDMLGMAVKSYDAQGLLKSEVRGARAQHFPSDGRLEIDAVMVHAFDTAGRLLVASAQHAQTDRSGQQVALRGTVRLVRAAGPRGPISLAGEQLHIDLERQRVRADQPVTFTHGTDRFMADRMDYDHAQRRVVLQGRVRGVMNPAQANTGAGR